MVSPRSVFVTGGGGFIGRHLVRRLLREGYGVTEYNRDASGMTPTAPGHAIYSGELLDFSRLRSVMARHPVDAIIHTAGQSHPAVSLDAPLGTVSANLDSTMALLECAREARISRVILMSSECAYGVCEEDSVEETHALHPTTPYGVTKAALDMMADVYIQRYGLDILTLRISQVYGPEQRMPEDVHDLLRSVLDGQSYSLPHGSEQLLQLIYVEDVVQAIHCALTAAAHPSTTYNVTGGIQISLGEVAEIVRGLLPTSQITLGSGTLGYDRQGLFALDRAQRELGYVPQWSVAKGIEQYLRWLQSHKY